MDPKGKRRAANYQRVDKNDPTLRNNKTRRVNPPEANRVAKVNEGHQRSQTLINKNSGKSEFADKLVTMWIGGPDGQNSLLREDPLTLRETLVVRESRQKCAEAEDLVKKYQGKVHMANKIIGGLRKSLREEENTNGGLLDKINTSAELLIPITEYINYITDTLSRCRDHKDHLSNLFENIMLGQSRKFAAVNNREEIFHKRIKELQSEVVSLKDNSQDLRTFYENELKKMATKLGSAVAENELKDKKLEALDAEKEQMARMLSTLESANNDLQQKISVHDMEVKSLKDHLNEVSTSLKLVNEEKLQLNNDFLAVNRETEKMVKILESTNAKNNEQSALISSLRDLNIKSEEKLKNEIKEREYLEKSLSDTKTLKEELSQRMKELKEETSMQIEEMKKKIELAEMEKIQILAESKRITVEITEKYESAIKSHVDNYESCIAEMKLLEANHQGELSFAGISWKTALTKANTQICNLENELDSLRREKNECEIQLRRVEDLLRNHEESEIQLRQRLECYQRESIALVESASAAEQYKTAQDAQNKEKTKKIRELDNELLKLRSETRKSSPIQLEESIVDEETEHTGKKRRMRKTRATTSYQKSKLKPSLSNPQKVPAVSTSPEQRIEKKVRFFDLGLWPESSPVKIKDKTNLDVFRKIENAENLFDQMMDIRMSSSQPSLENSLIQAGEKKFFKSRKNSST